MAEKRVDRDLLLNGMDFKSYIHELIENLINEDGSDLHLGVGRKPAIRINGQLLFLVNQDVINEATILGILNVLIGSERLKKFQAEKEIDFSSNFNDGKVQLRGNAFYQRNQICIAIRLVPKAKSFETLNLPMILKILLEKNKDFSLSLVQLVRVNRQHFQQWLI